MKDPLTIGITMGKTIVVRYMYPKCVVEVEEKIFPANLIELQVLEFDFIPRMDCQKIMPPSTAMINTYDSDRWWTQSLCSRVTEVRHLLT